MGRGECWEEGCAGKRTESVGKRIETAVKWGVLGRRELWEEECGGKRVGSAGKR